MPNEESEATQAADLPIGASVLVSDHDHAQAIFLRYSEERASYRVLSKPDRKEVLLADLAVKSGPNSLKKIDRGWWDIRLSGAPIGDRVLPPRYDHISIDIPARTIDIQI